MKKLLTNMLSIAIILSTTSCWAADRATDQQNAEFASISRACEQNGNLLIAELTRLQKAVTRPTLSIMIPRSTEQELPEDKPKYLRSPDIGGRALDKLIAEGLEKCAAKAHDPHAMDISEDN